MPTQFRHLRAQYYDEDPARARRLPQYHVRERCSPGEYQRRLRVEHAGRQLTTTRRSLAEIAAAAGFADQAHFSRVFKDQTGVTPTRFRATFGAR